MPLRHSLAPSFSALLAAALLGGYGCHPSHPNAGTDAGSEADASGTCYGSCDPTQDAGCGLGKTCSVFWELTTADAPVAMTGTSTGFCVPAGTYADSCVTAASCKSGQDCTAVPLEKVTATVKDTTFDVMPHMLAAVEMQLAGEPLAESMGRSLTGYSRDFPTPNVYFDPSPLSLGPWTDLVGFATAVESYEYSKQPMNELNFESGAGVSLAYGPVINPTAVTGMDAIALVQTEDEHLANLSGLAPAAGAVPIISWDKTLPSEANSNVLGWPGFWPTLHPYESFNPAIQPSNGIDWLCSIASDDTPGAANQVLNEDYECDYTTLHLPSRSTQITFNISPGSSGWAGWKSALWVMNYLQIMHDANENPVDTVPAGDLANVGTAMNTIVGTYEGTPSPSPGVYLGSSNIEGFQAGNMIIESENQAEHWLSALTTTDGATLSGFSSDVSVCTGSTAALGCDPIVLSALQYDFTSPLRWIPSEIAVTEDNPDAPYGGPFPMPTAYSIAASDSSLLQLDGLLGSYSSMYTLTDRNNTGVGGSQTTEVYFDGDPFPQDDGMPDGEPDLHDRALAMMRFVTVTLDRVNRDPASGVLVDDVTFAGGVPTRGATVATSSVAYTIVALRNVRRSLSSLLQLYSNTTPDEAVASTPLDTITFNGAPGGATFTQRVTTLLNTQAQLLMTQLTTADGHAYAGWNVTTAALTSTADGLDSYTAAIRGLLAAYLSTGDDSYRTRAIAVFTRMDSVFYDKAARIYDPTPAPVATVPFTPMRFAMLEGSLRDLWELQGNAPGQSTFGQLIQNRLARLIKLVLNGWDDANTNQTVEWPQECVNFNTAGNYPMGGLQMAERALSGELGSVNDDINTLGTVPRVITTDRESDCVPDIAARQLPSALANEVDFTPVAQ